MKTCNCKHHIGDRLLDISEFATITPNKTYPDGITNMCTTCLKLIRKNERTKNKDRIQKEQADWRANNKEYTKEYNKQYRESIHGKNVRYKLYVKHRAQKRLYDKIRWKEQSKVRTRHAAICARRRVLLVKAIPKWYSLEEQQIKELYIYRDQISVITGIEHHVDHIIPIQNKLVCGLHCLANLRVIPATENISKGNRLII